MVTGLIGRAALVLGCAWALAGCGSARFGGPGPVVASARPSAPTMQPELPPVAAVPSEPVTSEPLPPPPGAAARTGSFGPGPVLADVPVMPTSPGTIEPLVPQAQAPRAGASSRSAAIGGWTARDVTGASCRVSLTSSPSLDLYKASAASCLNKDLAKVTAWDFRDGEVYLYQPGGSVAARLRDSGGSLAGVLSRSGAPLTLTR